jgi:hypothetical protein
LYILSVHDTWTACYPSMPTGSGSDEVVDAPDGSSPQSPPLPLCISQPAPFHAERQRIPPPSSHHSSGWCFGHHSRPTRFRVNPQEWAMICMDSRAASRPGEARYRVFATQGEPPLARLVPGYYTTLMVSRGIISTRANLAASPTNDRLICRSRIRNVLSMLALYLWIFPVHSSHSQSVA